MQITKYLALPSEITPFERSYLKRLNKIALIFFFAHIPALMAVAWVAGTNPFAALVLSAAVMVGPAIAYRVITHPRLLSVVYGITAMFMGGLLVHFGRGPVQIEMHFYFFALLAMLCMFANPMVNIAAAVTVALHHLIVWLLSPLSVFNYEAQWWVVLVHAAFVVLETVAACYISREFFDNVIGLEKIVQARTALIGEKQRAMRLILDTIHEGLITIDFHGRLSSERSRALEGWFGAPAGQTLSSWLGARDAAYGEWLELGLGSLRDGLLPADVTLAQLPQSLVDKDRTYAVKYQLVANTARVPDQQLLDGAALSEATPGEMSAEPEKILVIVTDITERLRGEAAERHQSEMLQLFQRIMRDKAGFVEFLTEAEDIMRRLATGEYDGIDHVKRLAHTLNGNAAIFGLRRLSELCSALEDRIADERTAPTPAELSALGEAWTHIRSDLEMMIGDRRQSSVEIDDADYRALIRAVLDGAPANVVTRLLESWRLEPARKRLARVEEQIKRIADRLGKHGVVVVTEPHDVRFDAEHFAPFWSAFIHVLRNAVDHGVEDRQLRIAGGKPEQSVIKVSTAVKGDRFVVAVEDDGPGVDWALLQAKARELGVAPAALAALEDVMFLPGVSSKASVTEVSGRGVGMASVREACEALGGTVEVTSRRGAGTRISFSFPTSPAVYEGHAAILRASPGQDTLAA